ncbi:deoxyribodipyrimidine photo-lyase [Microbulbifer sp. TYP-18]|uniref:deoxyribodipyrimidine photo-lyase n=1 Tax=Microbulbifer sp. TYP-18 TaxID=3230024 RepID=UPI0034C5B61E
MTPASRLERGLVWFRTDLRLDDNTALYRAVKQCAAVAGIFLACPGSWRRHNEGDPLIAFRLACLRELQSSLAERNIPLYFLELHDFSRVPRALQQVVKKLRIDTLFANAEYPLNEQRRDAAVREALEGVGVGVEYCSDRTLAPPGSLKTGGGEAYKVFTPFKRAFISQWDGDAFKPLPAPGKTGVAPWPRWLEVAGPGNLVQTLPDTVSGYPAVPVHRGRLYGWLPGEKAARQRLQAFRQVMDSYAAQRDFPAIDATSRLSPYLNCGAISVRRCAYTALTCNQGRWTGGSEGASCWLSELLWREFYTHLIVAYPRLCMGRPFKLETDAVPWSANRAQFARWCRGATGVPIVDAAMRQLQQTGWMHNRLRMIVASFLSKNLLLDWRWGERFFMQHLIDGDFAANNGGWQWAASTGTDAAPYFRVFNPYSQSQKFDPNGEFIRRFVPELAGLGDAEIHCPPRLSTYPQPICDVRETRKRAIQVFAQLK